MTTFHRQRVVRADGRAINVVQRRAHLSYCFSGCCCGRTERGYAAVPSDAFKEEWLKRKLRNVVHLTKAGCLGPCALANVASLVFDGRAVWFHSVNTSWHVRLIFDYIETMVRADRYVAPPSDLAEHVFNYYDWDVRPKTVAPAAAARSDQTEHGIYLCDVEDATESDWLQRADANRQTAAVLFYRAHLTSSNLAFVDGLVDALEDHGLNALAVFTSSLRVREHGMPAALRIVGDHADVLISTLSFERGTRGHS
jgi:hypothetical protein